MKSRANVASNRDNKKVVAIIVTIIIMIAAAVFFFGRKNTEEDIPSRTWITDDTDPADDIERIKRAARKSRPTNGTYSEEFGALPNTSEAEADALLTEGALAEEAVGDLESKRYNVYDPELDKSLAGPEQPQETVSPDEVQQLIEETVEELPDPTPTPEPATPENPVIVDRTVPTPEPTPVVTPEPVIEPEPTPAPAAVEEAVAESEPEPGTDPEKDAACASIQPGGYWDGNGCVFTVDSSDIEVTE